MYSINSEILWVLCRGPGFYGWCKAGYAWGNLYHGYYMIMVCTPLSGQRPLPPPIPPTPSAKSLRNAEKPARVLQDGRKERREALFSCKYHHALFKTWKSVFWFRFLLQKNKNKVSFFSNIMTKKLHRILIGSVIIFNSVQLAHEFPWISAKFPILYTKKAEFQHSAWFLAMS
jgi:hypothetical protein